MQRDHTWRPSFIDLVRELKDLNRLEQQGMDMDIYTVPVAVAPPPANRWRSISLGSRLARPALPQVSWGGSRMVSGTSPCLHACTCNATGHCRL